MITIQEAIERTGKSEAIIRSFVNKYSGTQYIELIRGVPYVDERFLFIQFPPAISIDDEAYADVENENVKSLIGRDQFGSILDGLQDQIKELHQRLREQNHIMMKLAEQNDKLLEAPVRTRKSNPTPNPTKSAPPPPKPQMIAPLEAVMMLIVALGIISMVVYMFLSLK